MPSTETAPRRGDSAPRDGSRPAGTAGRNAGAERALPVWTWPVLAAAGALALVLAAWFTGVTAARDLLSPPPASPPVPHPALFLLPSPPPRGRRTHNARVPAH